MKARFFCDSCGASVGARADRCPACGKVFSAVRCPRCGYEGKPSDFGKGCPACGYLATDAGSAHGRRRSPRRPELRISPLVARLAGGALLLLLLAFCVVLIARS